MFYWSAAKRAGLALIALAGLWIASLWAMHS